MYAPVSCCHGLSPRVRGKQAKYMTMSAYYRSIPACAGETLSPTIRTASTSVYPRVCGGNACAVPPSSVNWGLSPRVRGKLVFPGDPGLPVRSIPACAGETLKEQERILAARVYPRVCGGNDLNRLSHACTAGLSPRVRGKPSTGAVDMIILGSIPACAGETDPASHAGQSTGVYPRVCGGNSERTGTDPGRQGLSPRVRGKRSRRGP